MNEIFILFGTILVPKDAFKIFFKVIILNYSFWLPAV